jgi:hypothetical protein
VLTAMDCSPAGRPGIATKFQQVLIVKRSLQTVQEWPEAHRSLRSQEECLLPGFVGQPGNGILAVGCFPFGSVLSPRLSIRDLESVAVPGSPLHPRDSQSASLHCHPTALRVTVIRTGTVAAEAVSSAGACADSVLRRQQHQEERQCDPRRRSHDPPASHKIDSLDVCDKPRCI